MNKDVVYIEPEEDITDIIAKIEGSKNKIVALVPPKKAGVFRSIVNIKLITKSAAGAGKTVVLVTTDPSIIKLAAATKMPVTKDLNTAPEIPEVEEDEVDDTETVDVEDNAEEVADDTEVNEPEEEAESDDSKDEEEAKKPRDKRKGDSEESEDGEPSEGDKDEKPLKTAKKEVSSAKNSEKEGRSADKGDKKAKKGLFYKWSQSNNRVLAWIGGHPKTVCGSLVGLVALIIFCVWAFAIAPAVTITLELETTTGNFSENISFTEALKDENTEKGVFYIQQKKTESKAEVEFEATGKKNVGEKASGTIKVTHFFPLTEEGGTIAIGNGATFTNSGLTYTVTSGANIKWDGSLSDAEKDCENYSTSGWRSRGCAVSATVTVTANDSGANYNISATSSGWSSSVAGLDVISNNAFSGGSDKTVTVVQQSDIDAAMAKISTENESVNKTKLLESLKDDEFPIESSFKQETGAATSTPALGEEVADGKKAKLSVTTTDTIFIIDETKLKEFIAAKAKLQDGYKIYEMNDPFIENFTKTDAGYVGKLKTAYIAGSTITENDVVETAKGKGIGSAKRDLSDKFSGIKTITFDTSVPWVNSVPGDTNKITVKIDVKE